VSATPPSRGEECAGNTQSSCERIARRGVAIERPTHAAASDGLPPELVANLNAELAADKSAAKNFSVDRSDVDELTTKVLAFWRDIAGEIPTFANVARVIFAMSETPSSASCERVFSLLDSLFGPEQRSALSDYIGGSLMLNYNKRGETW